MEKRVIIISDENKRNWKNKVGTGRRECSCGSWKNHWIIFSDSRWPSICSVENCYYPASLGAHVINTDEVSGEKIVPMCTSCNQLSEKFSLKNGVVLVSANVSETCGK